MYDMRNELRSLMSDMASSQVRRRAFSIALLVGSILTFVNQSDAILAQQFPIWWKAIITYCVPFVVSSYSQAAVMQMQRPQFPCEHLNMPSAEAVNG